MEAYGGAKGVNIAQHKEKLREVAKAGQMPQVRRSPM
jgi:hypothetical protein